MESFHLETYFKIQSVIYFTVILSHRGSSSIAVNTSTRVDVNSDLTRNVWHNYLLAQRLDRCTSRIQSFARSSRLNHLRIYARFSKRREIYFYTISRSCSRIPFHGFMSFSLR